MGNTGSVPFARKTSEDRVLGSRGDAMLLAGGVYKRLAHLLCIVALAGCAAEGARSETPKCIPYYNSVGVNVLDESVEDIAPKIVLDAIRSMGYSAISDGYATRSKECFIVIERPSSEEIDIVLYVPGRQPNDQSAWVVQMKEVLTNSISRLGMKDQLEVFELVMLEESFSGGYQYPP